MNPMINAFTQLKSEGLRERTGLPPLFVDLPSTLQTQATRTYFGQVRPIAQREYESPVLCAHPPRKLALDVAPKTYRAPYRGTYSTSRRRPNVSISSIATFNRFNEPLTWRSAIGTSQHLIGHFEEPPVGSLSRGDLSARREPTNVAEAAQQLPEFVIPAFMYLEHARRLLNQHNVGEARGVLRRGAECHPEDDKIGGLLRAISRGRASRKTGVTKGRSQEIDWLKRHGQTFRGKWVAVRGDRLVASAGDLTELLANIQAQEDTADLPLIQYLSPE